MMTRFVTPCIILAICCFSMTGCQTTGPNTTAGGLLGGTTGGILGAAIGSREGSAGEGAIIGAVAGGLTGATLGNHADQQELRHQQSVSYTHLTLPTTPYV